MTRIPLDWSRMLGFDQLDGSTQQARLAKIGRPPPKIGAKVSEPIPKIGRIGAKVSIVPKLDT